MLWMLSGPPEFTCWIAFVQVSNNDIDLKPHNRDMDSVHYRTKETILANLKEP